MKLKSLREDARYLVFGNRNNTEYADTDLNANINNWYATVLSWSLEVNGDWQINGDFATADIVAGQREYLFDSDLLKLSEVYIKSVSTGEYIKATQRDIINVETYPENYRPQTPEFDLLDNSLFIYIPEATITDVTDGIKIYFQGDLTILEGDNDYPNLPSIFTRILSIGSAIDYCLSNELWNKAKKLENRLYGDPSVRNDEGMKGELTKFIANRSMTKQPILEPEELNYT